jgi:cytochrome c
MAVAALVLVSTNSVIAEGSIEDGEDAFRRCKSCHGIVDPAGEVILKGGRSGPNLYGLANNIEGGVEGFRYSNGLAVRAERNVLWTEDSFVAWLADPSAYLSDVLGSRERSKMSFKVGDEQTARDLWAYINSLE